MRRTCVCCGKLFGQRAVQSETVKWPIGEAMPEYRGNGVVVKVGHTYKTTNRETVQALQMKSPNASIRRYQEEELAKIPEKSVNVATRWIWDGESYRGGYDLFCTLRCALDFARRSYNAGYRIKRTKEEA